ncbi:PREDICTED: lipopolysaccharide-responsive and beige-like anchor protein, partial [Amphimedon queenslandica]|uniref:DUF4704 domain-containing protein n=1 Tax=Amphimedon queenslandica TaxID=400682 RepID=A0AAN0JM07_AMPQE
MKLQLLTYINTLCTQNNKNCLAVLKIADWKELLLKFCNDNEDSDSLQSLLYQLFHTLLMYAMKEEEEGWRLWTQLAATIHSFRVKKGLATHRHLSSSVKPVEGGEPPAGKTDSQSSLTPLSVRALQRPRTASRSKVTDDDSELESQSEISLSDFNTASTTGLEITGAESTQPISPLVESTLTANTADTNTDINTDANTDTNTDSKTDTKTDTNITVMAPKPHQLHGKKKYPKFVWSVDHWHLFKQILNSIQDIIDKWNDKSLTERANTNLIQNTVQLLSPQLSLELGSLPLEDPSSPPPPLTPDTLRFSRSDSFGSSVASASDLKEVPPGDKPMQFFGAEGVLHPPTTVPLSQAVDVSEQVSVSLRLAGGCLCQVLVDHKSILSKVLTTVDGRNLLSEAALKLAEANSTVEITMLLCSQEWQTSLQKTAAKYFSSLITEGRHITHISESFIRTLAMNVSQSIKSNQEISTNVFTKYE